MTEIINYKNSIDSDNKPKIEIKNKEEPITKTNDIYSFNNAYNMLIIQKTLETHNYITEFLKINNPLCKMSIGFILLNPLSTWSFIKNNYKSVFSFGSYVKNSISSLIFKKHQPKLKQFEICYITENSINHLYIAFDWYLKTHSKVDKIEDYLIISMLKPIEGSKEEKKYELLKSMPEKKESEFIYDNYTFYYNKTSFNDTIYAPSGEIKKMNYKLLIWTYDCNMNIFDNLSNHVMNLYSKSKINDIWKQKIYTHDNGLWKDSNLERNKRKISSVIMKNNKNIELYNMLTHFIQTEEWHLERGIPYKKSFLFYGPPGTGKSSMIKAISYELQRHIHYLNLSLIKNDSELSKLMSSINYSETILVIEDIDGQTEVVHKRFKNNDIEIIEPDVVITKLNNIINKNQTEEPKLTLSGLLNQIDGINNNHGMILIMSTNYPDKLDEALIRDGRVDERLFFDYCDYEQIYNMFLNFYNNQDITISLIKSYINLSKYKLSPCNVENSMRRHYLNPIKALEDLKDVVNGNKKTFEQFEL